jgi:spermidine/putrescine-binding protein
MPLMKLRRLFFAAAFAFAFAAATFAAAIFAAATFASVSVTIASGSVRPAEHLSYDYRCFAGIGICVRTRHSLRDSLILDDLNPKTVYIECGTCGNDSASD